MTRDTLQDQGDKIWVWRHPRATGAASRCIGTTDLPVDRRKAKRLARRVLQTARRFALPRVVITSALQRSADVGRWLRRWGWIHRIDASIGELDFGAWDGRPWSAIEREQIDAWCADFLHHAPGGGERLSLMLERARSWRAAGAIVVIGHAGWMLARQWLQEGREPPRTSADWPCAPRYGALWKLDSNIRADGVACDIAP